MQKSLSAPSIFSPAYWKEAVENLKKPRMLVIAAMIVALRAICKMMEIPIGPGLNINVAALFNATGAMIYGPVVGLVGAIVSDPLGYLLHPSAEPYFLPFMLVDMSSSFLYGLFFWKHNLSVSRTFGAKFAVNMVCNVVLTSAIYKWSKYVFAGAAAAEAYNAITLVRIGKNLVLFPIEAIVITLLLGAVSPALYRLRLIADKPNLKLRWWHYVLVSVLTLLSIGLVIFYYAFLKDFLSAHNVKWF